MAAIAPFTFNSKHNPPISLLPLIHINAYSTNKLNRNTSIVAYSESKRPNSIRSNVMKPQAETVPLITLMEKDSQSIKLKALVTVEFNKSRNPIQEIISTTLKKAFTQSEGGVIFQLVSKDVDPEIMRPKVSSEAMLQWSDTTHKVGQGQEHTYMLDFKIESDFGLPGAIYVQNRYDKEFFLKTLSVEGVVRFACSSWVQPVEVDPEKRIFFCDKAYLPCKTPKGLIELREKELLNLRGDGKGLRLSSDRIYDYDVYNDLGDPDKGVEYDRPTLGGAKNPHPRRCRSGRDPTITDRDKETPASSSVPAYVPRDEQYSETKKRFMKRGQFRGIFRNIVPILISKIFDEEKLHVEVDVNHKLKIASLDELINSNPIFKILVRIHESIERAFKLEAPKYISEDLTWGLTDDEFGRRVLAGANPVSIEKLKVFPPVGQLDPATYGPQESSLNEEHITRHLNGISAQQAIEEEKLFVLDYHDAYLPFVDRINKIEGRKTYATRTIFVLTSLGTLKPIAIELSLPFTNGTHLSKRVLTPPTEDDGGGAAYWLWQLAKEHVCSNDSAIHTLVHHWLRIHACMEPFFISAHRNLSAMHPIFKLLHPHMRYLMKTNSFSREVLINAGGIIESFNAPAKYCMQLSCSAYRDQWRFDLEGLRKDLIRRGMAIIDPTHPNGLRLTIEDYPYAQDGLLIWSSIENLVTKYVNYYYQERNSVRDDAELQSWYNESIDKGHEDLRDAAWWPKISTTKDLIDILTNIMWTVTGQHAVLNFGQYSYGAHTPVRPSYMRRLLPSENDERFLANPREYFVSSLPSFTQAARYGAVLDLASGHSPDEEYIGEREDLSSWLGEPEILEAMYRFSLELRAIEKEIERRNSDPTMRNRCGDASFPFELLLPRWEIGGIPNSVTA